MTKNIKLFLLGLIKQGVKNFVISPGSRSTPIVLLLAEIAQTRSDLKLYIDVDERSASFFGIGLCKDLHQPVALICTSGTAATEYSSAVAEAKLSNLPLIVVTTDRPSELTNIGAPQAIDQVDLYGNNTKYFTQLQVQDQAKAVSEFISYETQRAVILAQKTPVAPIQINLPLRKPLMPKFSTEDPKFKEIKNITTNKQLDLSWLSNFHNKKIMLIAGPTNIQIESNLIKLSQDHRLPLVSDILSNTRGSDVVINFDLATKLLDQRALLEYRPDLIVKFGGTLVSANISQWLKELPETTTIINCSNNDLADHTLSTNEVVFDSAEDVVSAMLNSKVVGNQNYYQKIQHLDRTVDQFKSSYLKNVFNEMSLPLIIGQESSPKANYFLSNSMPVRDFENYFIAKSGQTIYCNRGANGIDGVVSSALGTAINHQENYLFIGDLALFHDMNGLMMAKRYQIPLNIVVVNNNGGGIFSFLPQAEAKEYFETLFGTPQDLDLAKIASLYDFDYFDGSNKADFVSALRNGSKQKIIEVKSDRQNNLHDHRKFEKTLQKDLADFVRNNYQSK